MDKRTSEDYYKESKRIREGKMKNHGPYKPYAIIDKFSFEATIGELKKGTPL